MASNLKRSLTLQGHSTSISLEPEFWAALQDVARSEKMSIANLVASIDQTRGERNLSSAIRVFILSKLQTSR